MNTRPIEQQPTRTASTPARFRRALFISAAGLLVALGAGAAEFGQYTIDELVQMRTRVRDMSEQDRKQYQEEMRTRTQNMSVGDRKKLRLERDGNRADRAQDIDGRQRMRSSQENDQGRGELTRQRSRTEAGPAGYGYGYEQRQGSGGSGIRQSGGGDARGR